MLINRVRELRKNKGWTLEELAERVGTTHATIQRIETGKRGLEEWIEPLCRALGVHPGELFRPLPARNTPLSEHERQAAEIVKRLPPQQRAPWLQLGEGLIASRAPEGAHPQRSRARRRREDGDAE